MRRLLFLFFLLIGLAARAQNWQPLRAGYTYLTAYPGYIGSGTRYANQLVADSASVDSQTVYLGYAFRTNPANDSGYVLGTQPWGGHAFAPMLYQRDHFFGRLCRKTSEGSWLYAIRAGRQPVAFPVNGGLRPGDSLDLDTLASFRVISKDAVIVEGQPDSLLTMRWYFGHPRDSASRRWCTAAFSKEHGIRQFPWVEDRTTMGLPFYDDIAGQAVLRRFPTYSEPGLPGTMSEWKRTTAGDTLLFRGEGSSATGGAYTVRRMILTDVQASDSTGRHRIKLKGQSRLGIQPTYPSASFNAMGPRNGPPRFSDVDPDSLQMEYFTFSTRPFESSTPIYMKIESSGGPIRPDSLEVVLYSGRYWYDSTLSGYRYEGGSYGGLLFQGHFFKTWDPFEAAGQIYLAQGPGYSGSGSYGMGIGGPSFGWTRFACLGRPGYVSYCGSPDQILEVRLDVLRQAIRAYPNPTSSTLTIEGLPANHGPIELINPQGQQVLQSPSPALDLKPLPPGLYQWRCGVYSVRVVKE